MNNVNKNHKRVRVIKCHDQLKFAESIKNATGKFVSDATAIAKATTGGVLLLNESSIMPKEWEKIANQLENLLERVYEYEENYCA